MADLNERGVPCPVGTHQYFNLNDPLSCCFACGFVPDFRGGLKNCKSEPLEEWMPEQYVSDSLEIGIDALLRSMIEENGERWVLSLDPDDPFNLKNENKRK